MARTNSLLKHLPGNAALTPDHLLQLLLALGGEISLKQLRDKPEGVRLAPYKPGSFLEKRLKRPVNLAPVRMIDDLPRLTAYAQSFEQDSGVENESTLVLIGRRNRKSHNSWMHNNSQIKQPDSNYAYMHPDDAEARQLKEKELIRISCRGNSIVLPVSITSDLKKGVIAVPHGWGHQDSKNRQSSQLFGDNVNKVIPGGEDCMEPVSGQAILLAHRVKVVKLVA